MVPDSTAASASETYLQQTKRKTSSLSMLLAAMFFSFVAGAKTIIAFDHFRRARGDYSWPFDVALAIGFLAVAIRWAILLLARTRKNLESPQI